MHAIYAVSWEKSERTMPYPLIWTKNKTVQAYDVSEYYIAASQQAQQDTYVARAW